jgi:hypothetical protein
LKFIEILNIVKIYHWKTFSYPEHKATDELYESLNGRIDEFVETMLGKTGKRVNLTSTKHIPFYDYTSVTKFKLCIEIFKKYLVNMSNAPYFKQSLIQIFVVIYIYIYIDIYIILSLNIYNFIFKYI